MDHMAQEQERASPSPPPPPRDWNDHRINIIDTRATSTSRSKSSGRCASSTARSPCSTPSPASSRRPRPSGVRRTTTSVPRMCFVNKMDRIGADFYRTVDMVRGPPPGRPAGDPAAGRCRWTRGPSPFAGLIDIVKMKALIWERDDETRRHLGRDRHPRRHGRSGRGVPRGDDGRPSPPRTRR